MTDRKEYLKQYRISHKDKYREYNAKYRKTHLTTYDKLKQENQKLKEEILKLEDKYIHNVPCCNEEDCDFYKKYKENEADLTTVYLKGYEDGKDLYNHYKLLYQKVKDRNDKAIEYIKEQGCYEEDTKVFCDDLNYYAIPKLLEILKGNNK